MCVNAKWRLSEFCACAIAVYEMTQRIYGTTRSDEDVRGSNTEA